MVEHVEAEKVEISLTEYENLIFYKEQINRINKVADELENGEIDGFDFGEKILNIL